MVILYIIYLVMLVIIGLVGMICIKIKSAGIDIKDFVKFILAINDLDNLYVFSKNNKNMTKEEQIIFLKEAEKIFNIFEKIPSIIWEDEYEKYSKVLDTYKDIRVFRWANI